MEKEFDIWVSKYPLPLIVTAFNENGDKYSLENIKGNDHLVGYVTISPQNIIKFWGMIQDKDIPPEQIKDNYINQVYKELPYQAREEKERQSKSKIRESKNIKRFFDLTLLLWLIVSIMIALLNWRNCWIGAAAFIYSLLQIIKRGLKLKGYKSKKDLEKAEIKRKKEHYYYHCELNPEGFLRLKAENFQAEEKERIKNEQEKIRLFE